MGLVIAAFRIEGIIVHRYWYAQTLVFPPSQQPRDLFSASVAIGHDYFGASVAIDGDTLAVAASDIRTSYTVGAVYVYVRNGSAWKLQAKLVEENVEQSFGFAQSVDISGNTIVVSTVDSVIIFERRDSIWIQRARIEPPKELKPQGVLSWYYSGIAIDGDSLVVGARGAAVVYTRDVSGTWNYETVLVSPDRSSSSSGNPDLCNFGSSVAISNNTIVVGSKPRPADGIGNCTNIFVRHPTSRQWTHQASLLPDICQSSQPCDIGGFGYSVGIDRDTIIVGTAAPLAGPFQYCASRGDSAYIFERIPDTSAWKQTAVLQPKGMLAKFHASRCGFGEQVAVSRDTAIVMQNKIGIRYLFKRDPQTGEWQYQAEILVDPQMAYRDWEYDSRQSVALSFPYAAIGDTTYSRSKESRFDSGAFYVLDLRSPKSNANK
ncbi:FG-GAP repeat protein [Leptolyngbya ohadii]|uniref:FG-GAP repeat protein n=1 Tax=Leptolyngbya ohadii TaxID=1962290 RepID=UPI000B5A0A7F|nr:FG-GAP repeat protein [Leptolyngbya ohadii]